MKLRLGRTVGKESLACRQCIGRKLRPPQRVPQAIECVTHESRVVDVYHLRNAVVLTSPPHSGNIRWAENEKRQPRRRIFRQFAWKTGFHVRAVGLGEGHRDEQDVHLRPEAPHELR